MSTYHTTSIYIPGWHEPHSEQCANFPTGCTLNTALPAIPSKTILRCKESETRGPETFIDVDTDDIQVWALSLLQVGIISDKTWPFVLLIAFLLIICDHLLFHPTEKTDRKREKGVSTLCHLVALIFSLRAFTSSSTVQIYLLSLINMDPSKSFTNPHKGQCCLSFGKVGAKFLLSVLN